MEQRETVAAAAAEWSQRRLRAEVDRVRWRPANSGTSPGSQRIADREAMAELDDSSIYGPARQRRAWAPPHSSTASGPATTLSAVELDKLKKTEGVRRCEYCRRILVF
jgi:hypothetical protein